MSEVLLVDNLKFEVRRSPRRKTLGLTVDRAGELVVHSPETASEAELHKWVERKLLWVYKKLLCKEELSLLKNRLEMVSGESIPYLGQNYRLRILKKGPLPLYFDGQWFCLREQDRHNAPDLFRNWFQDMGNFWLSDRIKHWEPKTGISASKIAVVDLGFRWGSCSKKGILYFNWRLLQLPVRLIDYIIAHELVHLHEFNHTEKFWQILGRVLPDWKERQQELGRKRSDILWRING